MAPYRRPTSLRELTGQVVRPVVRLQTYKNLLYLVLSFPLGFVYAMILGFSLIFGIFLSPVLVGLFVLLVCLVFVRLLSGFERWLSNRLLAVTVTAPPNETTGEETGGTIRAYLEAHSTWRGFGYLSVKLWFGIVGVVILVGFSTAYSMVTAVVSRPQHINLGEVNGEPVVWTVETMPEATVAGVIGIAIAVVLLHLSNLFGYVAGRVCLSLLGD